jgi:hypothetical protein
MEVLDVWPGLPYDFTMISGTPLPSARGLCAALLAATAIFSSQLCADSVVTDAVGFYKYHAVAGSNTFTTGFVAAKQFQGIMTSYGQGATNSTSVITQSNATWTANQFAQSSSGSPVYYIEILDAGATQGLILDIKGNTATTLEVYGNMAANGVSGTASYLIRKHATLGTIFPNGTGFSVYVDSVTMYLPNGTSANYLTDGTQWINVATGLNADNQIVYPGQGLVLVVGSEKYIQIGSSELNTVKTGPVKVAVYPGAVNLIGLINPTADTNSILGNMGFQSSFSLYGDSAIVFNSGNFSWVTNSLYDGSSMLDVATGLNSNSTPVANTTAVVVSVGQPKYITLPSQYTNN